MKNILYRRQAHDLFMELAKAGENGELTLERLYELMEIWGEDLDPGCESIGAYWVCKRGKNALALIPDPLAFLRQYRDADERLVQRLIWGEEFMDAIPEEERLTFITEVYESGIELSHETLLARGFNRDQVAQLMLDRFRRAKPEKDEYFCQNFLNYGAGRPVKSREAWSMYVPDERDVDLRKFYKISVHEKWSLFTGEQLREIFLICARIVPAVIFQKSGVSRTCVYDRMRVVLGLEEIDLILEEALKHLHAPRGLDLYVLRRLPQEARISFLELYKGSKAELYNDLGAVDILADIVIDLGAKNGLELWRDFSEIVSRIDPVDAIRRVYSVAEQRQIKFKGGPMNWLKNELVDRLYETGHEIGVVCEERHKGRMQRFILGEHGHKFVMDRRQLRNCPSVGQPAIVRVDRMRRLTPIVSVGILMPMKTDGRGYY